MDTPDAMAISCNAQRLLQKTSGPFNSGFTDVTHSVTSVDDLFEMTTDMSALTPIKDNGLFDSLQPAVHSPLDLPDFTDLDLEASSDFLEHFTDLSTLFNVELMETADLVPVAIDAAVEDKVFESVVSTASAATVVKETLKRKCTSASIPPDHSGYTVNETKRARVSSSTTTSDIYPDSDMEVEPEAPPHSKQNKYKERRRKNNIASRRSRETRKQKFSGMEGKAMELEASNAALRVRVTELEALAKEMKEILIQRMVAK